MSLTHIKAPLKGKI